MVPAVLVRLTYHILYDTVPCSSAHTRLWRCVGLAGWAGYAGLGYRKLL